MKIDQDTYNKIITAVLLVYCMIMFALSWLTGKQLNLESFLILVAPLVTHTIHLIQNKVPDGAPTTTTTTTEETK